MGYRNYLGSIPKKEWNKIKRMSLPKLYEFKGKEYDPNFEKDYIGVYDVVYNRHYELGKYVDVFDPKFYKPIFLNKETQAHFREDHDFYIVDKEFVKALIEYYSEKVRDYYKKMLSPIFGENPGDKDSGAKFLKTKDAPITDDEKTAIYLILDHVRGMGMEWGVNGWFPDSRPYDIDPKHKDTIVSSWKYEYAIFQLVHLYRTFDWKNNVMCYYGW